ncbi:60S ribosomal protein L31B [Dimargaris verticillata]|uniref:60S ribosomal protein L31B n=1 Tax=Dimargaris verticillata TaxID=2761393 RepID=A0A9W8BCM1_9FUNG|nr:60S ribosomal protein L31B [Dimargaris verticillata]
MGKERTAKRSALTEVLTREYTIHLRKWVYGIQFKKRAPRAVREVHKFARNAMGTRDVRLDPELNKFLWSQGIRNPPSRIRVRCARKRTDDENATEKLYTVVSFVPVTSFKGLETEVVDEE